MKSFFKLGISIIVFVLILSSAFAQAQFQFFTNPLIGEQAPDFKLETLSGVSKTFSEYRDGKSTIIFFWATWCPHCRTQIKILSEQKQELKEKNIEIVLVDLGESKSQVKSYVEGNNIDYDVFLDTEGVLSEVYGIVGLPTFYFVNKNGIIKASEHGIPDNYESILLEE
ncbi:MAG: TlpA disulfide reductase family protein [Candidatus Zapsychrus exili]|nr:TlpA disulfide reductase family protein [Candidatus Zapsychrus exili]